MDNARPFSAGNRVQHENLGGGIFDGYTLDGDRAWVVWDRNIVARTNVPVDSLTLAPAPASPHMAQSLEQRIAALEREVAALRAEFDGDKHVTLDAYHACEGCEEPATRKVDGVWLCDTCELDPVVETGGKS